jgi:hypothetical protein
MQTTTKEPLVPSNDEVKSEKKISFFSTAVARILILSKFFFYQLMHKRVALKEY